MCYLDLPSVTARTSTLAKDQIQLCRFYDLGRFDAVVGLVRMGVCVTGNSAAASVSADCFFYAMVPSLNFAAPTASFFLKPGKPVPPHPPVPPVPPAPPPPPPVVPLPRCASFQSQMVRMGCAISGSDCVLTVQLLRDHTPATAPGLGRDVTADVPGDDITVIISDFFTSFVPPKQITSLPCGNPISFTVIDDDDGQLRNTVNGGAIGIDIRSPATALWVVLSTTAQGRFSDNAFMLRPNRTRRVEFYSWGGSGDDDGAIVAELKRSLRVESLSSYL